MKGHACPALFAAWEENGVVEEKELLKLRKKVAYWREIQLQLVKTFNLLNVCAIAAVNKSFYIGLIFYV